MSDFFSGLRSGIKAPDVIMQEGPLPPTALAGMPAGFNGDPDGKINYNSTLLGDLEPYAYGGPARLSTQTAYLNIPHRAQRIIPEITIPTAQPTKAGGSFFNLSHQVQDGDVGFVIRCMFSPYELVSEKKKFARQGALFAIDPVCNLATVNYLLHGLQRYGFDKRDGRNWHTLWVALGIDEHFQFLVTGGKLSDRMLELQKQLNQINAKLKYDDKKKKYSQEVTESEVMQRMNAMIEMRQFRKLLCEYLVKHIVTPFGVPTGSDKQGGQHQGTYGPATWPVDFVTSMVIDGKTINLLNFWKHDDISAGDDLMLYLCEGSSTTYTLSHHAKSRRTEMFEPLQKWELPRGIADADALSDRRCNLLKRLWDLFGYTSVQYKPAKMSENILGDQSNSAGSSTTKYAGPGMMDMGTQGGSRHTSDIVAVDQKAAQKVFEYYLKVTTPDDDGLANLLGVLTSETGIVGATNFAAAVEYLRGQLSLEENRKSKLSDFEQKQIRVVDECIFQLRPGVKSSNRNSVLDALWRNGYWHIARTQVMHSKYDEDADIKSGANCMNRGKLLEATFTPMWMEGYEADRMGHGASQLRAAFSEDRYDTGGRAIKRTRNKDAEVVSAVEEAKLHAVRLRRVTDMWATVTAKNYGKLSPEIESEYKRVLTLLQPLGKELDVWQAANVSSTSLKRTIARCVATRTKGMECKEYFQFTAGLGDSLANRTFADLFSNPVDPYISENLGGTMADYAECCSTLFPESYTHYFANEMGQAVTAMISAYGATVNFQPFVRDYFIAYYPLNAFTAKYINADDMAKVFTEANKSGATVDEVWAELMARSPNWFTTHASQINPIFKPLFAASRDPAVATKELHVILRDNVKPILDRYAKTIDTFGDMIRNAPAKKGVKGSHPDMPGDPSNVPVLSSAMDVEEEDTGTIDVEKEDTSATATALSASDGPTLATLVQEQAASLSQPTAVKKGVFRTKGSRSNQGSSDGSV